MASPNLRFNPDKFEAFFRFLPRDTETTARLARKYDSRVSGRTSCDRARDTGCVRWKFGTSSVDPAFIELLRRHHVGLVVADTVDWPAAWM